MQRPDVPATNLRGLFTTSPDGTFWFRTIVPRHYPIPVTARSARCWRPPAATRTAPRTSTFSSRRRGYAPVTTHVFAADSPYLDSDAVFGVNPSLVRDFAAVEDPVRAAALGLPDRFRSVDFEVVLLPAP